jgi:hypothetical protein
MAYATPLCSALLLIALGLESPTRGLLVGAVLIVIAGFFSHAKSLCYRPPGPPRIVTTPLLVLGLAESCSLCPS